MVLSGAADEEIERHYRVPEVATLLGVSPGLIWRMVWRGDLRSLRIGTARRIPASAVRDLLEAAEDARVAAGAAK